MYFLLILVHSLFILISHLFGYFIIEGVFIVLLLFFLLYFSPIFFFKNTKQEKYQDLFSLDFSPQNSLLIPLILTYLGIYILTFTFSGEIHQAIHLHIVIFLAIFSIFGGYAITFSWKKDAFFDILSFHLLFSYITLIIIGIYYLFFPWNISILDVIFALVTLGFSYLFFYHRSYKYKEFLYAFLGSILFFGELLLIFLFPNISFFVLCGVLWIFGVILFESTEKISFFERFLKESRIFFLVMILFFIIILSILIFWNFSAIYFLLGAIVFLFSVHIRFFNVITYSSGIFLIYFLYTIVFVSLISVNSLFSTFMFIFFLPLLLIGNTYFWKERQQYDFMILHYSSIFFSIIFTLYSFFFFSWWENNFIFSAFSLLFLAILFFLSYFRFHKQ